METKLRAVFNFLCRGILNDLAHQELRLEKIEEQAAMPGQSLEEHQAVHRRRKCVKSHILAMKQLLRVLPGIHNFLLVLLPIFVESANRLIGLFAEGSPLDHLKDELECFTVHLQELHNMGI